MAHQQQLHRPAQDCTLESVSILSRKLSVAGHYSTYNYIVVEVPTVETLANKTYSSSESRTGINRYHGLHHGVLNSEIRPCHCYRKRTALRVEEELKDTLLYSNPTKLRS